jgi:hypothetical protein
MLYCGSVGAQFAGIDGLHRMVFAKCILECICTGDGTVVDEFSSHLLNGGFEGGWLDLSVMFG